MNKVVVALGSNIDPQKNIEEACQSLKRNFTFLKQSKFIQTAPIGYTDQDDFINGSVLLQTNLSQEEFKAALKAMEKELGREKSTIPYGPRTIDLDIVVFNGKIVDQDFYERGFVKDAVLELLPDLEY